jgi:mannose-1-phosphate guanylyltransferase
MLCALIMAGGRGTRFWPLSTDGKPKQFLNLLGEDTMIQMTVKRLERLLPIERIFVVTEKNYYKLIREQLPYLPERNIIIEPVGRNTAPCIALSAFTIKKYYENATIAVLPADHLIKEEKRFINILNAASKFVDINRKAIVTLGVTPDRPETGYGYIRCSDNKSHMDEFDLVKVEKFVEKPNLEKAREYLESGNYLWNGGMFIWKADTILSLTNKYLHKTYTVLSEIAATSKDFYEDVLEKKYTQIDSVSVDYGIMEHSDSIFVIPSDFGWDDVGNWSSIERHSMRDEAGNVTNKNSYYYKSSNNIALTKKKILLNNVEDLIIIETDEYILVSSKGKEQEIKQARELIREC